MFEIYLSILNQLIRLSPQANGLDRFRNRLSRSNIFVYHCCLGWVNLATRNSQVKWILRHARLLFSFHTKRWVFLIRFARYRSANDRKFTLEERKTKERATKSKKMENVRTNSDSFIILLKTIFGSRARVRTRIRLGSFDLYSNLRTHAS